MNLGQWIVIILSVLMLVWYVIMGIHNRRLGIRAYRWLREGLESRGFIVQARWIGASSTGAKLVWQPTSAEDQANSNMSHGAVKELHVSYYLENREIFPLWLFYHLKGQRDILVVQALLTHAPKDELIYKKANEKSFQQYVPAFKAKDIRWHEYRNNFYISKIPSHNTSTEANISSFVERWHNELCGIATQRKAPHIIIKMSLEPILTYSAIDFCRQLFEFLEAF